MSFKRVLEGAAVAALVSMIAVSPAAATVVFSDDFSDGDASDWTFSTDFTSFPGVGDSKGITVGGGAMEVFIDVNQLPLHGDAGARVARASHGITLAQGGDYTLSLLARSRTCVGCVESYDVIFDGVLLERAFSSVLVARSFNLAGLTAGAHTLTLGMHTTGLNNGRFQAVFDDVVLDSARPIGGVPEPTTWALMILGLGAAGATLRRRRVLARP